jgi:penicillin-binding protein 2
MDWRENTRYAMFTRRSALISTATLGIFSGLFARLFHLQVTKAKEYAKLAEENRVSVRLLAPLRGRIFDRFGVELASNRQNYSVVIIPEQAGDAKAVLDRLIAVVPRLEAERERVLREIARKRAFMPVTVAENLSWDEFSAINLNAPDLPGVQPDVGETRAYPFGADLAHVVGYVARVSENDLEDDPVLMLPGFRIGKSGIERTIDKDLRGKAGVSRVEVNAYGRVIRELKRREGTPGEAAVLTLDMAIQSFATERLRDQSAAAVVLDITNGDVLAFVSSPGFDPNVFNVGLTNAAWKALIEDPYNPLLDKVIAGQYPPGSTFKIVTALAGLTYGAIKPEDTVYCTGQIFLGNHAFHCWKKGGHGRVNLRSGIKQSCDIYFYEVARRTGIDNLAAMARTLGLGQDNGLELPNVKTGIVPSRGWKIATTGVSWQGGETLITGIGQGYLLATPLQLAVMVARLANGGLAVQPHLLRSVGAALKGHEQPKSLGLDPKNLALVREGMNAVSNEPGGTAYGSRIADLPGLALAGKTGTAQVRRITKAERDKGVIKNEDLPWAQRDHALFVAFAPVAAPRYAIAVVIEHGGGGSKAAAPVARDIMREVLIRDPARRTPLSPLANAASPVEAG